MFAIGDNEWPGLSKVIEEKDELGVELGKLMGTRGDTNHWSGNLRPKIMDECADVLASVTFFLEMNFNEDELKYVATRMIEKLSTYYEWQKDNPAPPTE